MQFLYPGLALTFAIIASGFALLAPPTGALLYFAPLESDTATTSSEFGVYIDAGKPINVVSGRIVYPKELLGVRVRESEDAVIDLWLEAPKVHPELGEIRFAGGTSKQLTDIDRALLFYIDTERLAPGPIELTITDIQTLERDGRGTPLSATSRSYTLTDTHATTTRSASGSGGSTPVRVQADFTNDGLVTLEDLSILVLHIVGTYEAAYDLNRDGAVSLGDLSTFFTVYGR
jgi:hypothetical protein